MNQKFKLISPYTPSGDQPEAINQLVQNINSGLSDMVLLGVTGSGKTYTIANVIERLQKPTLIISHNKTLAGQLYQEFREFFPKNAVEYFVSYYDYYQPESYIPSTDTYIEKEAQRNEDIERLRLSATTALSTRKDCIVIASVSCIYNLGSPVEYKQNILEIMSGVKIRKQDLLLKLINLQYERSDYDLKRATYRVSGDIVDIIPSYKLEIVRVEFLENKIEKISICDAVTGAVLQEISQFVLFPAKHYITQEATREEGIKNIAKDMLIQIKFLESQNKIVEAYRLKQKVLHDIDMIKEIGYCSGIENYSMYFDGRQKGEPPFTLMDYFDKDYLLVIDESHMSIPQIRGMYNGDRSRKQTLIDYGFRMPSALDNRPLIFDEFLEKKAKNTIYVSATPAMYELEISHKSLIINHTSPEVKPVVELIVRPTGLIDPEITIKPSKGQIEDLLQNINEVVKNKKRVLVTTLTKRMAEELSAFLEDKGIKVAYLHSDIVTLERSEILDNLRRGEYDVLVGINLLREGLDLPEVSLVAVMDADKEGFLRSETSLIQVMGRAARNVDGRVILYADKMTNSINRAVAEVTRRRKAQIAYNKKNGIIPTSIDKPIRDALFETTKVEEVDYKQKAFSDLQKEGNIDLNIEKFEYNSMSAKAQKRIIKELENYMKRLALNMEFEKAVVVRDKVKELRG